MRTLLTVCLLAVTAVSCGQTTTQMEEEHNSRHPYINELIHESFEDTAVARLMNEHFVAII